MATRIDHTTCSHERTPKARAACRARQRDYDSTMTAVREAKTPEMDASTRAAAVTFLADHRAKQAAAPAARAETKITRRSRRTDPALRVADRRMSEIRAAADRETWREARSSARKAALRVVSRPVIPSADGLDYGHCVQAALHTGGGRCACGWHTAGF